MFTAYMEQIGKDILNHVIRYLNTEEAEEEKDE